MTEPNLCICLALEEITKVLGELEIVQGIMSDNTIQMVVASGSLKTISYRIQITSYLVAN
jgi:hypothetical protein